MQTSTADAAGAATSADAKFAAAHQAMLRTRGLQFDFPPPDPPLKPPPWLQAILKAVGRALEAIAPAMKYVFWAGLALLAALLIWVVVRELLGERLGWRKRQTLAATDLRPEAGAARSLLEEADALARTGRFGEAARLLLLRSVDDLNRRKPGVVKPSFTSRDIAALAVLPEAPRAAFASLARHVERSLFAGRALSPADFDQCRADYEAFAFAEGWR